MGEIIKGLGLVPNLAALVWAAYGGYLLATKLRSKADGPDTSSKELSQAIDLQLTEGFDQLRRDLTTTSERQHTELLKEWNNALQRFMLELEIFVMGGQGTKRRKDDR
jgi:hypothetical protein